MLFFPIKTFCSAIHHPPPQPLPCIRFGCDGWVFRCFLCSRSELRLGQCPTKRRIKQKEKEEEETCCRDECDATAFSGIFPENFRIYRFTSSQFFFFFLLVFVSEFSLFLQFEFSLFNLFSKLFCKSSFSDNRKKCFTWQFVRYFVVVCRREIFYKT